MGSLAEDAVENAFTSAEAAAFPSIVNLEVLRGRCPCRCRHCPVGLTTPQQRRQRFGEEMLSLALFTSIAGEVGRHPWSMIRVHGVGDPILWPDLPAALAVAAGHHARSWVFTSAVTTDRDLLRSLCEMAAIVEVSINSCDAADYRHSKGVDAFELVSTNLQYMHELVRAGSPARLIVSRVETGEPDADEAFVRFWKSSGLVDDAFVRSYHTYNHCLSELDDQRSRPPHQPCLVHWARCNVDVRGRVVVCFNELFKPSLDPALVLGRVGRKSITEIWRGPQLEALRRAELSGDYSELAGAASLPCRSCSSCQPLRGARQTSEHQLAQLANARAADMVEPIEPIGDPA
jgi:MoaA/NifB/PqqE/SkfB family radical SAM enzyme